MPEKIEKKEGEEVVVKKDGEEKAPEKTKTADELKAEAEAVEAEIKAIQDEKKDEELASNQARRLEKAKEKLAKIKADKGKIDEEVEQPAPKNEEIETRDLITLGKHDIAEDSEKAKILNKYKKGGLIKNFAEGLTHPGVKAEFDALDAKGKAKSVINENDSDDVKLKTKQEVIANYKASGEVPKDPKLQKEIADSNLKEMGM